MRRVGPALLAIALTAFTQDPPRQPDRQPSSAAGSDSKGVMRLPDTISAPPWTVSQKFNYRVVHTFGPRGLGFSLTGATLGQASGTPYAWGGGVEGFAKRYASGFAGTVARQSFAFGIESALHEDPRYFPSQRTEPKARLINAAKQVFLSKTDGGKSTFAYGPVASSFASGQFVNLWQPRGNDSVGKGLLRGVYGLGADFAFNLLQEFVPFTRPASIRHSASAGAKGRQ